MKILFNIFHAIYSTYKRQKWRAFILIDMATSCDFLRNSKSISIGNMNSYIQFGKVIALPLKKFKTMCLIIESLDCEILQIKIFNFEWNI